MYLHYNSISYQEFQKVNLNRKKETDRKKMFSNCVTKKRHISTRKVFTLNFRCIQKPLIYLFICRSVFRKCIVGKMEILLRYVAGIYFFLVVRTPSLESTWFWMICVNSAERSLYFGSRNIPNEVYVFYIVFAI